jgi:tRNA A-37 threonylcarbamoyl transferase component Bud32
VTGALLGERYRLDQLIGRGGMAAVWSATDTVLARRVAIKRLHAGLLADEEHAERFRREAVLVARLSHPNLVHLLDRGEDDAGPYLVMELVEGENLKTRVRREGALDPEEAARICGQVGRALAYAHSQGVVHRDIKAQNVLLTPDGAVKLADFGIARLMEPDEGEALTRTDMLLGSADYLSPEQADGRPVDARTDVYSLGILLYECLTGELPFTGEGFVAVAMKHCSDPLPDPRDVAPGVPEWLAACAMRAAAKDPDARFPDAARMVAALQDRDAGTAVMPVVRTPLPAGPEEGDTARRRRPRRRALAWVLAAVVLLAAAAGGALLVVPDGDGPGAPATVPLTLSAIRDYDPQGDDGTENPAERGLAIDQDPETAWYTEQYRGSPEFGGLKDGVGLLLRLTEPAEATELAITSPTPGVRMQLLGELVGGEREVFADFTTEGGAQTVPLTTSGPSQSYLLWITSLVDDGAGGYWAGVGQVELRGAPNRT